MINSLLSETEALIESGGVYFHTETRTSFLKKLKARKSAYMHRARIFLPANRAGRRFRRENVRSRHRPQMTKALGFS